MVSFNMMLNLDVDSETQCNLCSWSIPIPANVSEMLMFFYPHEMRPDEQAQKFHIDDLAYGYPDLGSASDPIEVCRGGHPLPTHQF